MIFDYDIEPSISSKEDYIGVCRDGEVFVREYSETTTHFDLWGNSEICLLWNTSNTTGIFATGPQ